MNVKRTMLVGTVVAAATIGGAGGLGIASAATANDGSTGNASLVDKLAGKFHLNKADVQAVFDADRKDHQAAREADQQQRLADAVKDGKLTQAQADHITAAIDEIRALRGNTDPRDLSADTKSQIRDKMDALHDWAKDNNIDMHYAMMGPGGPHGHGRNMME